MILHIGGMPGSPGTRTTRDSSLRSMSERIAAVERGSWSFPSSSTRVTDQDCISSSRGRRPLTMTEEAWHLCCCERTSLGALFKYRGIEVEETVRRANRGCDCSIGAMKILCRAAAVLDAHLELLILAVPCPCLEK